MRGSLTRLRRRLVRRFYGDVKRQYLPYVVPGLAAALELIEPLRRRTSPARSLDELERMLPPAEIEHHQACPLCGTDSVRLMYKPCRRDKNGRVLWSYAAGRCTECGLLRRVPGVKPDCVPELYSQGTYSQFLDGVYGKSRRDKYLRTMRAFHPYFDDGGGRRLLDFGCGTGVFLEMALERGFDAVGVDLSPDAVERARLRLGQGRAWCGDPLAVKEVAKGGFDVITLWSVLAHLADPVGQLETIRSLLAPGGGLLIYTVNAASLELKAYTDGWNCFTRNHLMFWEPSTLRPLLRRSGFKGVAFRDFYGGSIENDTGTLTESQRARVVRHVERFHSGSMMRAIAINAPIEAAGIPGTERL